MMYTIRASALSDLFSCPARFEAKHIKGLRLPRSSAAQLGTAIHASTGVFDASKIEGNPITADDAAGALVDAIHRPEEDVTWDEDLNKAAAEKIGLALHGLYCRDIAPAQEYVGVEVNCERLEITDLDLALTGTTDRVRLTTDGLGIVDIKTGKRAVGTDGKAMAQGHALQIGVYELLAQAVTQQPIAAPAQIVGLQVAKTAAGQRAGTAEISRAREVLLGNEDHPGMLHHAAKILREGLFYGNPRDPLCSDKYCPAFPSCRFRA